MVSVVSISAFITDKLKAQVITNSGHDDMIVRPNNASKLLEASLRDDSMTQCLTTTAED